MKSRLDDYERWKATNKPGEFSLFDYAYASLRSKAVSGDSIIAIAEIVWPRFIEIDGLVFLAEQYSEEKLSSLRARGMSSSDVEYWINLFSVDGLFYELEDSRPEQQEEFATTLQNAWRTKLAGDFPHREFDVRVVRDVDAGDLCLVFTQKGE